MVRSTDGGQTFGSPIVAASVVGVPWNLPDPFGHAHNFRTLTLPAFAVDRVDGTLLLALADYRQGDSDIYFARSTNRGAHWTAPVRLNDDPGGDGFIGDYQGIASSNAYDFSVWNATANLGQNPINRHQIFVARVPAPASRRLFVPMLRRS